MLGGLELNRVVIGTDWYDGQGVMVWSRIAGGCFLRSWRERVSVSEVSVAKAAVIVGSMQ